MKAGATVNDGNHDDDGFVLNVFPHSAVPTVVFMMPPLIVSFRRGCCACKPRNVA